MKYRYLLTAFFVTAMHSQSYDWAIIGAGPAGIATVGLLLDSGVTKDAILWIDPEFNVGRLGTYYTNVPGNSKAQTYHYYVNQCSVFKEVHSPSIDSLMQYDPVNEPFLSTIVAPLKDITTHLLRTISHRKDTVMGLTRSENAWNIQLTDYSIYASNVILATGCHPHVPTYHGPKMIDLDLALDKEKLTEYISSEDTVAVVGSAHSAALILMYLHAIGIPTIHLYKHPFQYKYDMGAGNPTTIVGLQGIAAHWTYNVYENKLPESIVRVCNTQENRAHWLPQCTKIIYAVGYVRNTIPGWNFDTLVYDSQTGVIEPHLFGIGLAFPEEVFDHDGTKNYAIGLIDFMKYGQQVVPQWVAQHERSCSRTSLEDSFIITQL
jgi:thioredoxin reductase